MEWMRMERKAQKNQSTGISISRGAIHWLQFQDTSWNRLYQECGSALEHQAARQQAHALPLVHTPVTHLSGLGIFAQPRARHHEDSFSFGFLCSSPLARVTSGEHFIPAASWGGGAEKHAALGFPNSFQFTTKQHGSFPFQKVSVWICLHVQGFRGYFFVLFFCLFCFFFLKILRIQYYPRNKRQQKGNLSIPAIYLTKELELLSHKIHSYIKKIFK